MRESLIPLEAAQASRPYGVCVGHFSEEALGSLAATYPTGILWFVDEAFVKESILPPSIQVVRLEWLGEGEISDLVRRFHQRMPFGEPEVCVGDLACEEKNWQSVLEAVNATLSNLLRYKDASTPHILLKQRYSIEHLRHYFERPFPEGLRGIFCDFPAVVVGAGPSLDVSLPAFLGLQDRCLVIATDSALHALHYYGVQPDFTISIDGSKRAAELWPEGMDVGALLLSTRSAPDWFDRAQIRWTLMDKAFLAQYWMHALGLPQSPLQAWCSGGYTGIALARFLGCSSVTLLGLDCASSPEDAALAYSRFKRDSYPDDFDQFRVGQRVASIPGNYEAMVPSIFEEAWRCISRLVSDLKSVMRVYNLTDRGALIDGAVCVHPSVAQASLSEFMRAKKTGVRNRLKGVCMDCVDEHVRRSILKELATICNQWRSLSAELNVVHKNAVWAQRFYAVLAAYLGDYKVSAFYDLLARYFVSQYPSPLLISPEEAEVLYGQVNQFVFLTEQALGATEEQEETLALPKDS